MRRHVSLHIAHRLDSAPQPVDVRPTGRNEVDIQTLVDVGAVDSGIVTIHIHNDGTIAVQMPSHEVSNELIRNRKRTNGIRLSGREADRRQPVGEQSIPELNPVRLATKTATSMRADAITQLKNSAERFNLIDLCRNQCDMTTIGGKVSVGRKQSDSIG